MDSENTSFQMPVMPAYGGNYGGNGGGFGFGGDWAWILLLLLIGGNGWGMGGFGMGGMMWPMMMGGMGGGFGIDYLYPWLNNSQHISDGFRDQNLNSQISDARTDINRGFGDVALGIAGINQNLCQTGNNVVTAVNGAQNAIAQQLYTNQIADMERSFAAQTQAADCCCKTQNNIADLKYTVATENCADRQAISDGIRDLLAATQAQTQTILTQMCNDKLEAKNDLIAQLRQQLNMADLRASQTAQTAELRQSGATQLNQLVSELRSCPIPAQPVYGNQPIFQCSGPAWNNNGGCGCGNNVGGFNGNF